MFEKYTNLCKAILLAPRHGLVTVNLNMALVFNRYLTPISATLRASILADIDRKIGTSQICEDYGVSRQVVKSLRRNRNAVAMIEERKTMLLREFLTGIFIRREEFELSFAKQPQATRLLQNLQLIWDNSGRESLLVLSNMNCSPLRGTYTVGGINYLFKNVYEAQFACHLQQRLLNGDIREWRYNSTTFQLGDERPLRQWCVGFDIEDHEGHVDHAEVFTHGNEAVFQLKMAKLRAATPFAMVVKIGPQWFQEHREQLAVVFDPLKWQTHGPSPETPESSQGQGETRDTNETTWVTSSNANITVRYPWVTSFGSIDWAMDHNDNGTTTGNNDDNGFEISIG